MAEEPNEGGQNIWLLLVSLGLGLVVVVIYNVHIYNVRAAARGETILCVAVTRDLADGDVIREEDLETRVLPRQYDESLATVVRGAEMELAVGEAVNQPVEKGRWLQWEHITGGVVVSGVGKPRSGNVAIAIAIDSRLSPGDILVPNDRVHILGQINGKMHRIIKGVRVLAVGGRGDDGPQKTRIGGASLTSYRSVTVEMPEEVSIQWANVQTHVNGGCWLEIIPPGTPRQADFLEISPALKKYAEGAAGPGPGARPGPSGVGAGGGVGAGIGGSKTWE
jgi:Flp pilus assembly protein CpaB